MGVNRTVCVGRPFGPNPSTNLAGSMKGQHLWITSTAVWPFFVLYQVNQGKKMRRCGLE